MLGWDISLSSLAIFNSSLDRLATNLSVYCVQSVCIVFNSVTECARYYNIEYIL